MSKYDDLEVKAKAATQGEWQWFTSNSHNRLSSLESGKDGDVISAFKAVDGMACVNVSKPNMAFIASANPQTVLELIEIAKAAENMLLSTNRWEQLTLALRLAKLLGNPGIYATSDPEPPEAA